MNSNKVNDSDAPASELNVSERALLLMRGPDSLDLLHRISTNDLTRLAVGDAVQTVLTSEKGRIIDVVTVIRLDADRLLLAANGEGTDRLVQWLEKFIIMEDATVSPTSDYGHVLYFEEADRERFGSLLEQRRCLVIHGDIEDPVRLPAGAIVFREQWDETSLIHVLSPRSGPKEIAEGLDDAEPLKGAFERFRVQVGIPKYPNELSEKYNPLEANLNHLISWTKGCYVGQEVIARLDTYQKLQRKLVKFEAVEMEEGLPCDVHDAKDVVGSVTSAVRTADKNIRALGFLRPDKITEVQELWISVNGRHVPVKVVRDREEGPSAGRAKIR